MGCTTAGRLPHAAVNFDAVAAVATVVLRARSPEYLGTPRRLKRQAFLVLAFASCPRSLGLAQETTSWWSTLILVLACCNALASQQLSLCLSSSRPPRLPRSGPLAKSSPVHVPLLLCPRLFAADTDRLHRWKLLDFRRSMTVLFQETILVLSLNMANQ